jgi:amidohydrolase
MERFDIAQVFGIHNGPGLAFGSFHTAPGPIMAAADTIHIRIQGKGGHGARPSECVDPVVAACGIVQAIQTISSRNHNPAERLVISVTQVHTGSVDNVIPDTAYINGTVRTFNKDVQAMVVKRLGEIVEGQAASYGVSAKLDYEYGYPPTVNDANRAQFAAQVAREVVGDGQVDAETFPRMGAEDFSYLLESRPGAFLFLGQGEGAGLHHPMYNFNDEVAPVGASFFVRLVERAQPLTPSKGAAAEFV